MLQQNHNDNGALIAYADDLLLFAESEGEAQRKLDDINVWAKEHNMTISTKKTYALRANSDILHDDGTAVTSRQHTSVYR